MAAPFEGSGVRLNIFDIQPNLLADAAQAFVQSRREAERDRMFRQAALQQQQLGQLQALASFLPPNVLAQQAPELLANVSGLAPERISELSSLVPLTQAQRQQQLVETAPPGERRLLEQHFAGAPLDVSAAAGKTLTPVQRFQTLLNLPGIGQSTLDAAKGAGIELPPGFQSPADIEKNFREMQQRLESQRLGLEGARVSIESERERREDRQFRVSAQLSMVQHFAPAAGVSSQEYGKALENIGQAFLNSQLASGDDFAKVQPVTTAAAAIRSQTRIPSELDQDVAVLKALGDVFAATGKGSRLGPAKVEAQKLMADAFRRIREHTAGTQVLSSLSQEDPNRRSVFQDLEKVVGPDIASSLRDTVRRVSDLARRVPGAEGLPQLIVLAARGQITKPDGTRLTDREAIEFAAEVLGVNARELVAGQSGVTGDPFELNPLP